MKGNSNGKFIALLYCTRDKNVSKIFLCPGSEAMVIIVTSPSPIQPKIFPLKINDLNFGSCYKRKIGRGLFGLLVLNTFGLPMHRD